MSKHTRLTRRQFIQGTAAAGMAGPLLLAANSRLRAAPSERINLGFIGVGTMGSGHVGGFLGRGDVQIVAICDVVEALREFNSKRVEDHYAKDKKSGEYKGCKRYGDFRELLQHPGLDAVLIATPDHWHAIPCVEAAKAKKDIYCEKPLTHSIAQGRKIVEAVTQNKVIFQTGSQQRSEFGGHFRKAVEYVRSGRIGKIKTINIGDGVGDPPIPCDLPDQPTPEGTDWEMWLGPAPKRGYNSILCPTEPKRGFPAWRRYVEYAGGGLADMGAHHFDIAQWALDMDGSGPVKIEPPKDEKALRGLRFVYASGIEMIHAPSGTPDCSFIGEGGVINARREGISSDPDSILKQPIGEDDYHVYPSNNHHGNWIDCIKSRKETICPAETGHRSATICHLAKIGYQLRRNLAWDPAKEQFVNDDESNKLLDIPMRDPWKL